MRREGGSRRTVFTASLRDGDVGKFNPGFHRGLFSFPPFGRISAESGGFICRGPTRAGGRIKALSVSLFAVGLDICAVAPIVQGTPNGWGTARSHECSRAAKALPQG